MIKSFRRHKPGTVVDIANLDARVMKLEKNDSSTRSAFGKVRKRFEALEKIVKCPHGETDARWPYRIGGDKFCRDCGEEF